MGYQLLNVFVFALVGVVAVVLAVALVSRLLRPKVRTRDEPSKEETYECGEPAMGTSWIRFDIRFYTVALVFLIFDVEVAFLYPWALVFKSLRRSGAGLFVFAEVLLFLVILGVGFVYCWRKGDLDWVKSTGRGSSPSRSFPPHRLPERRPAAATTSRATGQSPGEGEREEYEHPGESES